MRAWVREKMCAIHKELASTNGNTFGSCHDVSAILYCLICLQQHLLLKLSFLHHSIHRMCVHVKQCASNMGRVCHWRWGSFDAPLYPFWVNLSVSYWIKLSVYRLKVGFLRGISDIGESVLVLTLLNSVVFFLVYKVGVTWRLSSSYWIQTKSLPSAHGKKRKNDETRWNTFMPRLCQAYRN